MKETFSRCVLELRMYLISSRKELIKGGLKVWGLVIGVTTHCIYQFVNEILYRASVFDINY
jgi:hypothetical protein